MLVDSAIVIESFAIALLFRFNGDVPSDFWTSFWPFALISAVIFVALFYESGVYQSVLELQRSARQVLERSHQRLSAAVNEAAIETLAQYGSVIKGLDSDDRISVLIFTPPRWAFGPTRHGDEQQDEYVISVRYKDIRDYDNQKIDLEEFRSRVRIHSRLGTVIELSQPQR